MGKDLPTPPNDGGDADDPLTRLRAELEGVDDVPIADRVALFDRANTTIARELAELDEV